MRRAMRSSSAMPPARTPDIMPAMIDMWRGGADVVYGVRSRRDTGMVKRVAYHLFYRVLNAVSEIDIPVDSGDFSLMDRKVVDAINALPERNRFVRGLRAWVGYRQSPLRYDRPARRLGRTTYSFGRLLRLAVDGIFDFSTKPLTIIYLVGLVSSVVLLSGFLFFLAHRVIGFKIFGHTPEEVPGITSVILAVFFFGGVQLLAMGVLGEYIGRIYREVKRRPPFMVKSITSQDPYPRIGRPTYPNEGAPHLFAPKLVQAPASISASLAATLRPSLMA